MGTVAHVLLPLRSRADEPPQPSVSVRGRRAAHHLHQTALSGLDALRRLTFEFFHTEVNGVLLRRVPDRSTTTTGLSQRASTGQLVPIDHILLGGDHGISATRLAATVGDPLLPSTRVLDACAAGQRADLYGEPEPHAPLLRQVRSSDYYQLQAPSTELIRAIERGDDEVRAIVLPGSVTTPLQDLLTNMWWLGGAQRLYQPIDAPELERWTLVRRCTDRLDMMLQFLHSRQITGTTYLDVASSYGWFVAAMRDAGYDARGVELDPLAARCGEWVYGLEPGAVDVAEASAYLPTARADVVSCFSLLHHAVIHNEESARDFLRKLDAATGQVLFIDMGQGDEEWHRHLLPGWTPPAIEAWLALHTTFSAVYPLGVDQDRTPANGANYGRTLFACVR
jgi:hypothetical protein